MPEQRQAFQRELDAIDAKVIELFDLVAADLATAAHTLPNGNNEVVRVLAEHGLVIDLRCPEVENLVKTAILLQAPVASDLRFLLCVLRILPSSSALTTSSYSSPPGPATFAARTSHPAAGNSSNKWGTSHPTCGAGPRTPGTSATIPPPC